MSLGPRRWTMRLVSHVLCCSLFLQTGTVAAGILPSPRETRAWVGEGHLAAMLQDEPALEAAAAPWTPEPEMSTVAPPASEPLRVAALQERPAPPPAVSPAAILTDSAPADRPQPEEAPREPVEIRPEDLPPFPLQMEGAALAPAAGLLGAVTASSLLPSWNLASVQNEPVDKSPAAVFASLAGKYNRVFAYDACTPADPWKVYDPADAAGSDLTQVDQKIGFWIEMTAPAAVPNPGSLAAETTIHLCPGWNLIGFPAGQARPVRTALSSIEGQYVRVFGFDPADGADPWEVYDVAVPSWANDLELMQPGRGYWVLATAETDLTISNAGAEPEVAIASPAEGTPISSPVEIVGTVQSNLLESWSLGYRLQGDTASTLFATGNTPVTNGVLGTLDPTLLLNGLYEIELTATDFEGRSASAVLITTVEGEMKIGNFTLPFLDMEVPVLGLPIQVVRTYDSRDKRKGDFGYGWTLSLTDVRLQESVAPGDQWQGTTSGGPFPTYCIQAVRLHVVSVALPSGEVLRFTPRPSPECQQLAPPQVVNLGYTPLPGTRGTLEPLDQGTQAIVVGSFPGSVQLWDQGSTNLLDPDLYRLTLPDGRTFVVHQIDGLRTLADNNGNVLTFQPNGIVHSAGSGITIQRDSAGRISHLVDPLLNSVSYGYDSRGDLVSVTDQEGQTTRFTYLDNHLLHTIIDPAGRQIAAAEYEPDGRLKRRCDASSQCFSLVHDLSANREIRTDATGRSQTFVYDDRGNILSVTDALGNTTRYGYDSFGNKTKKTDATGAVTSFGYDSQGYLVSVTDPYPPGAEPEDYTTRYVRNSRGQATAVMLPTGSQTHFDYDTAGNLTGIRDDTGRQLLGRTYGAGGTVTSESDPFATITYASFSPMGQPESGTDPLGGALAASYDAAGRITGMTEGGISSSFSWDRRGRQTGADYGLGPDLQLTYGYTDQWTELSSPSTGTIRRHLDANGRIQRWEADGGRQIEFRYDAAGRVLEEKSPLRPPTLYDYDEAGRLRSVTSPSGGETRFRYDPAGRVVEKSDEQGRKVLLTYGPEGRLQTVTDPNGSSWSYAYELTSTRVTDPLGRETRYDFSPAGLPIRTVHPDGTFSEVSYLFDNALMEGDEHPASVVDEGGHRRDFTYDSLGRLSSAEDLSGAVYTYGHGAEGVTSIQGPTGETVLEYSYDALGNLASFGYADGGATQIEYGAANLPTRITRPAGEVITLAYDATRRLSSRSSLPAGETVGFTWDAEDRLTQISDGTGTSIYSYDASGELSDLQLPGGAAVEYARDSAGRVIRVAVRASATSAESVTLYEYDPAGHLKSVTDPLGGVTSHGYDAAGRLVTRTLPNGVTTAYRYNDRDQIVAIEHTSAGGQILASVLYERQGVGEPTRITREDGSSVRLEYDAALRLIRETYADPAGGTIETVSYTYDAAGNRLTRSSLLGTSTYTYQPGYRLTQVAGPSGTEAYGYDGNGRVRSIDRDGTAWSMIYDAQDQLRSVAGGAAVTYDYDAAGRRVRASSGSVVRRFLVAPAPGTRLESTQMVIDEAGHLAAGFVHAGLQPLMRYGPDGPVYYLTDGMGSVIGLADSSGAAVASFHYDAFGNLRSASGSQQAPPAELGGDFRYHGAWLEQATGLYHFRARDYDPRVGRFLVRDAAEPELEIPESTHPYLFAFANPHLYTDPTGAFTMMSVNISMGVQNIVGSIRTIALNQLRSYLIDKVGEALTRVVINMLEGVLPLQAFEFLTGVGQQWEQFESGFKTLICDFLGPGASHALWFEPVIQESDGKAIGNGYQCHRNRDPAEAAVRFLPGNREPDFLFKQGEPKNRNKKGLVIGDIKIGISTFYMGYISPGGKRGQWEAMYRHAQNYQYPPWAVVLVAFRKDKDYQWQALLQEGLARKVALIIFSVQ